MESHRLLAADSLRSRTFQEVFASETPRVLPFEWALPQERASCVSELEKGEAGPLARPRLEVCFADRCATDQAATRLPGSMPARSG
jgi:hypothetical protein